MGAQRAQGLYRARVEIFKAGQFEEEIITRQTPTQCVEALVGEGWDLVTNRNKTAILSFGPNRRAHVTAYKK